MDNFNSKEYAWIDVTLVMLGKPVTGFAVLNIK